MSTQIKPLERTRTTRRKNARTMTLEASVREIDHDDADKVEITNSNEFYLEVIERLREAIERLVSEEAERLRLLAEAAQRAEADIVETDDLKA